jgi:hypothetical protein
VQPILNTCAYPTRLNPRNFHFCVFLDIAPKSVRATNADPRLAAMRHASVTEIPTAEITALGYRESISRLIRLVILMFRSIVTREALFSELPRALTHGISLSASRHRYAARPFLRSFR